MRLSKISAKKSKTIGVQNSSGRTDFKKLEIYAEADINEQDIPLTAYQELSKFIDNCFELEKK
jgi:hypothetical protein